MTLFAAMLVLALPTAGFGMLSISMDRHAKQVFGHPPAQRMRHLRTLCGWSALILALWPAVHAYGLSIGIAVWFGVLAIVSTALVLLLSYQPRFLRFVIAAAIIAAIVAALAGMG